MSFYTSLSGLRGAQTDLSTTANNIANVGSIGFKRSRASFGDIMAPSTTQAGIGTLKSLGLLQAAAQRQVDYSTLADPVAGPIFADLPAGSYLSLGQVVKLHQTNPELAPWCR